MNFQRGRVREEPEINLIPMIDVLLVILIFMMVTTTYSQFSELQINLPQAGGEQAGAKNNQINISVDASEHYSVNNVTTAFRDTDNLAKALRAAAGEQQDPTVIINADAKTPHQAVVNIMEAARIAGFGRITFTTNRK
ncbi:MAG: biopolymer transporter ExbD [Pseudomonadota bacterium]